MECYGSQEQAGEKSNHSQTHVAANFNFWWLCVVCVCVRGVCVCVYACLPMKQLCKQQPLANLLSLFQSSRNYCK